PSCSSRSYVFILPSSRLTHPLSLHVALPIYGPSSSARGMASNSLRLSMVRLLGGEDPYRALLVVGLLGNRIGRVQSDLVDQLAGIEPGHEHHPTWHAVAAAGLHPGTHLPAARLHPDLVAALEPAR